MNENTFREDTYLGPPRKLDEGVLGQVRDPAGNGEVPRVEGWECVVTGAGGEGVTMAAAVTARPASQVSAHCILSVEWEDRPVREDAGAEGQVRNKTLQRRNRVTS